MGHPQPVREPSDDSGIGFASLGRKSGCCSEIHAEAEQGEGSGRVLWL
jgi:hypothetical protein